MAKRAAVACLLALVMAGCSSARRPFYASCGFNDDCESSLCSDGFCTSPCSTSSQCGGGYCDGKVCRPDYRCPAAVDGGAAAPSSDGGVASNACQLVPPQCGCPFGQGCYVPDGKPVCLPAGKSGEGGTCAEENDCRPGSACVTGMPTGPQCQTMCDPAQPDACPSGVCIPSGIAGLGACMVACDMVSQTGCGDRGCYAITTSSGGFVSVCGTLPGQKTDGQACTSTPDCLAGHVCANQACRRLCRPGGAATCAAGTCQDASPPFVVGKTVYGVCLP